MNKLINASLLYLLLSNPSASAQICLGINCPEEPFSANTFVPGRDASQSDWDRYAMWQGLTAGFHMVETSFSDCLEHCEEHAAETESVCRTNNAYAGFGKCENLYQTVYLECAKACKGLPH